MQEKQSRTSLFVRLPGLFTLLFFAVLAIYFGAVIIAIFLLLLTLICMISRAWSEVVIRRIIADISPVISRCHVGDCLRLSITIKNNSFFPLIWLDVIIPTGIQGILKQVGSGEDIYYDIQGFYPAQLGIRQRLIWLMWHQEISWDVDIETKKRGTLLISGLQLQAGDGFGLSAHGRYTKIASPFRLMVCPTICAVRIQPFLKSSNESIFGNNGNLEDVTVLKTSRAYMSGDSMKRVNWRLLAKGQPLTVNVYEKLIPGCIAFILDLSSFKGNIHHEHAGHEWDEVSIHERDLEGMISLIASLTIAIKQRGLPVALVVPAYADRDAVIILPNEGDSWQSDIMEALAQIDYRADDTTFPLQEFVYASHLIGQMYICSSSAANAKLSMLTAQYGQGRVKSILWQKDTKHISSDCLFADDIFLDKPDLSMYEEERGRNSLRRNEQCEPNQASS